MASPHRARTKEQEVPPWDGLSIEDLLANKRPDLPLYGYRKQGGHAGLLL